MVDPENTFGTLCWGVLKSSSRVERWSPSVCVCGGGLCLCAHISAREVRTQRGEKGGVAPVADTSEGHTRPVRDELPRPALFCLQDRFCSLYRFIGRVALLTPRQHLSFSEYQCCTN